MIALKICPIAQVLLILFGDLAICYPSSNFYNSEQRLSRSTHQPAYDLYDYYSRNQRYPLSYYPSYAQLYPDEYYYNPFYYVSPRASKYDLYQADLPYYYRDVPVARNKYNYYNYGDPTVDDQERLLQEIEREQRERLQPIGHEIRYETDYNSDDDSSRDETSAAFLNNLMMQQMYHDSVKDKASANYYEQYPYTDYTAEAEADTDNFPKWNDVPYDRPVNFEDEDVKELKELPKKQKQRKNRPRKQRKQNNENENLEKKSDDNVVVYTDRKPAVRDPLPTSLLDLSAKRNARGQKEEVLMRPATPVRHPFSDSVLGMLNQQEERKRSPSVYDTIRHMLEMEKKYEENAPESKAAMKPAMKKRIVSSEDSLTRQLSVLKKAK